MDLHVFFWVFASALQRSGRTWSVRSVSSEAGRLVAHHTDDANSLSRCMPLGLRGAQVHTVTVHPHSHERAIMIALRQWASADEMQAGGPGGQVQVIM